MKTILLLLVSLFISISFADESVDFGSTLGAYGELHWKTETQKMDFHRLVVFLGHQWDNQWSFKSETKFEYNQGNSEEERAEIDQAYITYDNGSWGFKGGVLLAPVGIINPYHEPPTFLSVERPGYAQEITGATWVGNGFSFYGNIGNIELSCTMLEDLDGEKILTDKTIKNSRSGTATDILGTKIFSISWTGIDGLRIGGSYAMNDAPVEINSNGEAIDILSVSLIEINTMYSKNNIHTVFEYGNNDFSHSSASWTNSGYYLDIGYNIGDVIDMNSVLMPWIRTSSYSIDDINTDTILYGLTYKPIPNISFKIDMGTEETGSTENNILNIGLGYMF